MIRLTSNIKKAFLRSLYNQCQKTTTPLILALNEFLLKGFESCGSGRLVISHAGAGKSTSFEVPEIGKQFRQEEVFALADEFIEMYDQAIEVLELTEPPTDNSQDASIFKTMLLDNRVQDIDRTQGDYTTLLFPWK